MLALSIDGFHPRPTLPHSGFSVTSTAVPSSLNLCALWVSVLSSPDVDPLDAASSISPVSATLLPRAAAKGTKNTGGWVSVSIVNPIFQSNHRFISNSHRITSFAHPYPLTPIESYSCKKQGGGVPIASRLFPSDLATRRNAGNSNPFKGLLHNLRTLRVGGAICDSSLCRLRVLCVSSP